MYTQKNGILLHDGEPVLMLGTSYYPSFHPAKYPVPPEGDRIGVMKEDFAHMRSFGFNQVRIAALGEISLRDNGEVIADTSFVDEMVREADRNEITSCIRLQGYVTNLRGNNDYLMMNEKGEEMEKHWSAFVTACLFHDGINRDTEDVTKALSKHFAALPGVLSLQTLNEPHYPYNGVFDYHPLAVKAYKEWLSSRGLPETEPPRRRPYPNEDCKDWINWRLFSMRAMSGYLNRLAELSADTSGLESLTCATSGPGTSNMMNGGLSYFDIAEKMDLMGITTYVHLEGADFYTACYVFDLAESAAATFGKHAWTVEADARTHMPARKLYQSVYAILGAGHKGINFYEWKGDYPAEGSPNPDNCGFVFHDGTKTGHYDSSKLMMKFLNKHSNMIARTEKHRDGFGILYSEHAFAYTDARMSCGVNLALNDMLQCYREARELCLNVDFVRAADLERNPLGVKLLIVPYTPEMLSDEEKRSINAFDNLNGHAVYRRRSNCTFGGYNVGGYWRLNKPIADITRMQFDGNPELYDIIDEFKLEPFAKTIDKRLRTAVLDGDDYKLVMLVNSSVTHSDITDAKLTLSAAPSKAVFLTPTSENECVIKNSDILLPPVREGGIVVVNY